MDEPPITKANPVPDADSTSPTIDNGTMAPSTSLDHTILHMFRPFQALAPELRALVYNQCLSPRLIKITEFVVPLATVQIVGPTGTPLNLLAYTSRMKVMGAVTPNLFHAIPEAKYALIDTRRYKTLFTMRGTNHAVYFNPDLDTVQLETNVWARGFLPWLTLGQALANILDLDEIKHISLPLFLLGCFGPWTIKNLRQLRNLQSMKLTASYIDRPRRGSTFILNLYFEKKSVTSSPIPNTDGNIGVDSQKGQSIVPKYSEDGTVHYGDEAMHRVFRKIEDPDQQVGLMALWADLEQINEFSVSLPPLCHLYAHYAAGLGPHGGAPLS